MRAGGLYPRLVMPDAGRSVTRPPTPRRVPVIDAGLATVYLVVVVAMAVARAAADPHVADAAPPLVRFGLVFAMGLPVALRRVIPGPAFAVCLLATAVAFALGVVHEFAIGASLILYEVAAGDGRPLRALSIGASAVVAAGVALLLLAGSVAPVDVLGPLVVSAVDLAGAWSIGRAVRERRRYAERAAADRVARAVADERLRIARDLHDIVAHGLSLIVVRAATAGHVIDARPEEARSALADIETVGRAGLGDMRRMLAVLRSEAAPDAGGAETQEPGCLDLEPAPGLSRLADLAGQLRLAGVEVDLDVRADDALPQGVSLAAYRIVQEALTNVARHAAPAKCRVTVARLGSDLEVEVVDDGSRGVAAGPPTGEPASPGHGLIGMRERVRALGGEFSAAPLPRRGFRVHALIPLEPDVPASELRSPDGAAHAG